MAGPAYCSTLSLEVSTQSTHGLPPRTPAAHHGKHRLKSWLGGKGSIGYSPQAVASSLPSASAHVPVLSEGEAHLHEGKRKNSMTSQTSFKARETANERQLTHLSTRLKYRGPNTARLDPDQETQRDIVHCATGGFRSSATSSQSQMDSIPLLPSHCWASTLPFHLPKSFSLLDIYVILCTLRTLF